MHVKKIQKKKCDLLFLDLNFNLKCNIDKGHPATGQGGPRGSE